MRLTLLFAEIKHFVLGRYWIRQRNKIFPKVDITAYRGKEEYWRLKRLIRVYSSIPHFMRKYIHKLHDHKGTLSAYVELDTPSLYKSRIQMAWRDVYEVEDVYFYELSRHDGYFSDETLAENTLHDLAMLFNLNPKKSGSNYIMKCPFHHEATPSFVIDSLGEAAYCFGCKASFNNYIDLEKALLSR